MGQVAGVNRQLFHFHLFFAASAPPVDFNNILKWGCLILNHEFAILQTTILNNGQQLVLRKPVAADAEKIIQYLNLVGGESDNLLFGRDEFPLTIEQEVAFIQKSNEEADTLMVIGTIGDSIVSIGRISCPSRSRIAHNSELAISVRKDYWRCGIGRAVMAEMIRFARSSGTIKTISLGVKAGNTRARRMYERFGFITVGSHKDYFNINGSYDDEILMDLYL